MGQYMKTKTGEPGKWYKFPSKSHISLPSGKFCHIIHGIHQMWHPVSSNRFVEYTKHFQSILENEIDAIGQLKVLIKRTFNAV